MEPRVHPLEPPYLEDVARTLSRMMPPGLEPICLFRTLAHHLELLERMRSTGAYLLNHGRLEPVERETAILRTTARAGSEYEWGVHVVFFSRAVGLTAEQVQATALGDANSTAWNHRQRLIIRLVDELHDTSRISDALWSELTATYEIPDIIELIALAGQYRYISYLTNALRIQLEDGAPRFPVPEPANV